MERQWIMIALMAAAAGLMQGITGMGGGMLLMLVLPFFFTVQTASAVSGAICLFLTAVMALRYRKKINYRLAILPALLYMAVSGTAIHFSAGWDSAVIRKALGLFLLLLALWFLLLRPKAPGKPGPVLSAAFIAVSGLCDGLFSVGSPLMVLFYLSRIADKEEYLGTIQLLFFLTLIWNTALRISHRILLPAHIPVVLAGMLGICAGLAAAGRIVSRIRADMLRRFACAAIAFAGLYQLFA